MSFWIGVTRTEATLETEEDQVREGPGCWLSIVSGPGAGSSGVVEVNSEGFSSGEFEDGVFFLRKFSLFFSTVARPTRLLRFVVVLFLLLRHHAVLQT